MRTPTWLAALALLACRGPSDTAWLETAIDTEPADDIDGDGYLRVEDCDDEDPAINPGADELCNGIDDNCDGTIDEDAADAETVYLDDDGDGYGAGDPLLQCDPADNTAEAADDCDDTDPAFNPGAEETDCADPNDYNCDGSVGYADGDGDGFAACEECNDADATISPDAVEATYDGIDNDCDPATLDDDLDEDGFDLDEDCDDANAEVSPDATEVAYDGIDNDCDPTTLDDDLDEDGYVGADDCDDTNADVSPDATELPYDGVDNDCDPATLDDDLDGDGFVGEDDCDDTDASINPDATEVPYDGADNDCDPSTLEDDLDDDGYGTSDDCDDADASINPGVDEEPYDGIDNDCDPATSDDDLDGDGATGSDDCDDTDPTVNPSATEQPYDGIDNDCNPATLDDDLDGDGFVNAEDCNDGDATINPGADETPYDGSDNDCDPATLDDDLDGDGFDRDDECDDGNASINPGESETTYDGIDNDCDPATLDDDLDGDGFARADECDDTDASINPGESETTYDGIDNDCDPSTLDDDLDQDGFARADECDDADADVNPDADETPYDTVDNDCDPSTLDDDLDQDGFDRADECDDGDATINPDADEVWYDGVDQDCSGGSDFDQDGDGGDSLAESGGPDCDDLDPSIADCSGIDSPAPSCLVAKQVNPDAEDGIYLLDPPGNSGDPFKTWCDMTTDGGGYTFHKLSTGNQNAAQAENTCAALGMQLFIPRTPDHLESAYNVATSSSIGPDASANYLYMLGIYPKNNGDTCLNMPMTSQNPRCGWQASDQENFFVHWRWDVSEPNGDNSTTGSMYYDFQKDGDLAPYGNRWDGRTHLNWHNDISGAGYTSPRFMCDVGDKTGPTPAGRPQSCQEILKADPSAESGVYTIEPIPGFAPEREVYCDMTTDGGGWTLVGKGRQGWEWYDQGQGDLTELQNVSGNEVSVLPAWEVQGLIGTTWDSPTTLTDGLRINRAEQGQEVRWNFKSLSLFRWYFPAAFPIVHTVPGTGRYDTTTYDTINQTGNNHLRIFTWAWSGHNYVTGWSTGASTSTDTDGDGILDVDDGWVAGNRHAQPQTQVWVRE